MSDSRADELRSLRARAYGPGADIFDDPAAVRRLAELESITRTPIREPVPAPEPIPEPPAEPSEEVDRPPAGPPEPPGATDAAAPPASARRAWWRRPVVLWAASIVVAVVATALVTHLALSQGPRQVAVLAPSSVEWPQEYFGEQPEGGQVFDDFYGVTVIALPQQFSEDLAAPCLYVLRTGEMSNGMLGGGCGAGAFTATAAVAVTESMPEALRDRFPDGGAVQFVLDGDRVLVYADETVPAATVSP